MPKTKADETWRDWTPEEQKRQPKRTCSVAGCKNEPKRVKETPAVSRTGAATTRRHVYCAEHAAE